MASSDDIALLRRYINRPDNIDPYTDETLGELIDTNTGNVALTASQMWTELSAGYAELTDVQEGSSKRSLGNLFHQAIEMSKYYAGLSGEGVSASGLRPGATRLIERP